MTSWQPTSRTAWWRFFLAAVAAVLGVLLSATTASAATPTTAQTRVGAITITTPTVVGFDQAVWASQHQVHGPPQAETASATGVAAKAAGVLPTPVVESTKLQNIVNNLYKGTTNPNRVGIGTTMDAIRKEIATGAPIGGHMHITKGQESLRGLDNWLGKNSDAPYPDRLVARSLADELRGVLPL